MGKKWEIYTINLIKKQLKERQFEKNAIKLNKQVKSRVVFYRKNKELSQCLFLFFPKKNFDSWKKTYDFKKCK